MAVIPFRASDCVLALGEPFETGRLSSYEIETIEVLRGKLPRRAHALVVEWTTLHRAELAENWDRARQGLALESIEPLD